MPETTPTTPATSATEATPATPDAAKVEAKVEPKAEEKKETPLSSRFAALAKKEKGLVLKMQDLKAKEESFASQRAEHEAWKKTKESAKLNPLQALEALGLTYEDITQFVLNDKKPTADLHVKAVKDELEAFKLAQKQEREQLLAEEKKRIEAEQKAAIDSFHRECIDFVKSNAAEYELTAIHDPDAEVVMAVVQQHFEKTQRVLSKKEAADLVEKHFEAEVQKALATKKFAARAQPQPPKEEAPQRSNPAQSRTLTNGMSATTPSFTAAHVEQDRMKRALAAMEAALKK